MRGLNERSRLRQLFLTTALPPALPTAGSVGTQEKSGAEAFFKSNALDRGALAAGSPAVDVSYSLAASEPSAGFGVAYDFGFGSGSSLLTIVAAEPSTWAMTLTGLAFSGFAGRRGSRAVRAASAAA